ncbi:MAG: glycosyltransferase family 4 protein [Sphingomonadales bacterium]|nr:glycosyltransferase family 4 protein [Sphingomonadales bacterium]
MADKRIGYLVSEYPAPSHTFIRREIDVLRRKGLNIATFSIRRPAMNSRLGVEDQQALTETRYLFPVSLLSVLSAQLWAISTSPGNYLKSGIWATKHAAPGLKEFLWRWIYFFEAIVLARMLSEAKVTHLHSHFANSAARVGLIASKFLGIPWSVTLHGAADWAYPNGYLLPGKVASAEFVACVSHYTRSQAMWRTPESDWGKMFVARCGIDLESFAYRTDPPRQRAIFRIVNIGRLVPEKAQVGLIEALSLLRSQGFDAELRIVGAGPLINELKKHIARCGVEDRCTLLGQMTESEVKEELREADVFVMTSLMEGLPVVLMEAMAIGVPVVAPGVAGIPELVEHEHTGLLFFPGDWEGLAHQLVRLIDDAALRQSFSEAGRIQVAKFHDIEMSLTDLRKRLCDMT